MRFIKVLYIASFFTPVMCFGQGKSSLESSNVLHRNSQKLCHDATKRLDQSGQHCVEEGKLAGGVTVIAHKGKLFIKKHLGCKALRTWSTCT